MFKVDAFKLLLAITKGMQITQAIMAGKSKAEKVNNAIAEATDILQISEFISDKDLLKDEALQPFIEEYMTAAKALVNKVHELKADAKALKP